MLRNVLRGPFIRGRAAASRESARRNLVSGTGSQAGGSFRCTSAEVDGPFSTVSMPHISATQTALSASSRIVHNPTLSISACGMFNRGLSSAAAHQEEVGYHSPHYTFSPVHVPVTELRVLSVPAVVCSGLSTSSIPCAYCLSSEGQYDTPISWMAMVQPRAPGAICLATRLLRHTRCTSCRLFRECPAFPCIRLDVRRGAGEMA